MVAEEASLTKRLIKKGSIVTFYTVLTAPVGYIIKILYSRTLTVEEFGLLYAVIAFIGIFKAYQDLGFSFSLSYYTSRYTREHSDKQSVLVSQLLSHSLLSTFLFSLLLAVLVFFSADWLAAEYFKVTGAGSVVKASSLLLVATGISMILKNLFIGLQKEAYFSSAEFVRLFSIVLFSGLLYFSHADSVFNYTVVWSVSLLVVALHYIRLLYRHHKNLLFPFSFDWTMYKKLFVFTPAYMSNQVIYFAINQTGLIFLTLFVGVTDVGVYSVIIPIVSIPSMFLNPLQNVLFPIVTKLAINDKKKLTEVIEQVVRVLPFFTLYFNFFILLFPKYIIGLLFSNQWISAGALPLVIMAIGYVFNSLAGYFTRIIDGMGLIRERMKMLAVIAVINLAVGWALIFAYGVTGLVITQTITSLATIILFGLLIRSRVVFEIPWMLFTKYLLFLLAIYIGVETSGLVVNTWSRYLLAGVLYTTLTALFALHQQVLAKSHTRIIHHEISKLKSRINLF